MAGPTFPEDYYATVELLEDEYEGEEFPAHYEDKSHFECDWCSKGVAYASNPRCGHYMSDRVAHSATPRARTINQSGTLSAMGTYCEECSQRLLLFPCRGYTEVRLFFDLDEDRIMQNVEVTDISARDDGIPWDPAEVSEQITNIPIDEHASASEDVMMAPENIVTWLLSISSEIDVRELVQYDGSLDPKALGRARRAHEQYLKKMQKYGNDRAEHKRQFRDHVQGGE